MTRCHYIGRRLRGCKKEKKGFRKVKVRMRFAVYATNKKYGRYIAFSIGVSERPVGNPKV